jgi:1-acyl-sn-glycerol-3-phosphate acyltransferase
MGMKLVVRRSDILYRFIRGVGYVSFNCVYRIKVEGRENIPAAGPAILLPKHQFWTDIPIMGLAVWRPMNFIAKQELFIYPGVRHFISALGGVPIHRLNPIKSLRSFRYVEQLLKQGEFIVLFPEGTYYPHAVGRGKHRFVERILRTQGKVGWPGEKALPFIPVGIRYNEKKFRTEVHVKIGRPIYSKGESRGEEFTRGIVEEIAKLSGLPLAPALSHVSGGEGKGVSRNLN